MLSAVSSYSNAASFAGPRRSATPRTTSSVRRPRSRVTSSRSPARTSLLGFTFEGVFRQAVVYKGRSRDTAWFSIVDGEWPRVKAAFEAWLDPANFDAEGRQLRGLTELRG